ncbi:MAG: hypothetical protein HDQ92_09020 [Desulfovibrio sp.]|nr:hypothetical protein [Desulfovibrio sp.]
MKTFRLLRLDHLVIDTENLPGALEFYAQLPEVQIFVEKGRGVARIGQQKINIHEYPPTLSPVALHPTPGHQAFSLVYPGPTEPFQEYFPQAPAWEAGTGGLLVQDSDGNRIGLGFGPATPGALPRLDSLTLLAPDMEASLRFYAEILGLEGVPSGDGHLCQLATGSIRLVRKSPELVGGAGDFCLITDAAIETVMRQLAGAPLVPGLGIVRRQGALGPMRSVYLRDPAGNLVEIAEYERSEKGDQA